MNTQTKLGFPILFVLLNTFSNGCQPEKKATFEPVPVIEKAYNNENALAQVGKNPFVFMIGYFHPVEIRIEATKYDRPGYLVIKPFSYVHEPNPSLGWPSWFAQKAVLVNMGWISQENAQNHTYKFMKYDEALFTKPVIIHGFRRNISGSKIYDGSSISLKKKISYSILWKMIDAQVADLNSVPYGREGLPVYLDLILGPPGPELWNENISTFSEE